MKLNREGNMVGETHRECSRCGDIFEHTGQSHCNPCNTKRVKSETLETKMYRRAKSRARLKNIPFDITPDDIEIPDVCPILGIALRPHTGRSGAFRDSPSLDRIVPEAGYVKDNIQVISQQANQMKTCATTDDLLAFARWVFEMYGEENENN